MDRGGVTTAHKGGAFLDSICSLQPVMIPRPKCQGMEFVTVKGRQGYYMSTRRRNDNNGPRRPPLAGLFEHIEKENDQNQVEGIKSQNPPHRGLNRLIPAEAGSEEEISHQTAHLQHVAQQVSPVGSSNSASSSETEKRSEEEGSSTISSSDTDTDQKDYLPSPHPSYPEIPPDYNQGTYSQEELEPAPDYDDSSDLY